jgi:hypothetical protein
MSIEEIVKFVEDVMQTPEKFNKGTFAGRLNFGIVGEMLIMVALERGIIENYPPAIPAPKVTSKDKYTVAQNAKNGDVYFFRKNSNNAIDGLLECIDVKGTNYISNASLGQFRNDGWYFMNALVESPSMGYFMIRNNPAFRIYLGVNSQHLAEENGVRINFSDIPPNPKDYGLEMYPMMDASRYLKLVQELKRALQNVCPDLIKDIGKDPVTKIVYKVDHLDF